MPELQHHFEIKEWGESAECPFSLIHEVVDW